MLIVSVTRLRVRAFRFMPAFFLSAIQANRQAQRSPGFLGGSLLQDRRRAFWTLTLWDDEQAMRGFVMRGSHRAVMPRLLDWCDEASVVRWEQGERILPSWEEAARRMRAEGRPSKLRHPGPAHQSLAFDPPRTSRAAPITPRIQK